MQTPKERVHEIEQAGLAVAAARQSLTEAREECKQAKQLYLQALEELEAISKPLP